MKKFILSILLSLLCNVILASTIPTNLPNFKAITPTRTNKIKSISDSAKFYLVTCEPGAEIYERFGHSGIRVYDSINNIDNVFHWGLFSFDTPNFIGRFISGNTDYEMGVYNTNFFLTQYIERGSAIYAQELDLIPGQKHFLWAKLWDNYRPENRKYRYNFIYDNCATRPYQLIISAYDHKVTLFDNLQQTTYRNIINKYVPIGSLFNTGINLIIGSDADKNITTQKSIAFPMYTKNALNYAHYITHDGSTKPIVTQIETMNCAPTKSFEISKFTYYFAIIIPIIVALFFIAYTFKKRRYIPYFTQLILIISALIGFIIGYLWFFSHHPIVNNNMNILWCNPLNIILAILLFIHKKSLRSVKAILSLFSLVLCIIFPIILILEIQTTTPQILSLWVLMTIINYTITYTYKRKIKSFIYKK